MDSKKVNIFAIIMIVVMCAFSIYIGIGNGNGKNGVDGKSAYELAVESGQFQGTEEEFLQTIITKQGEDGKDGKSAYEIAVESGVFTGTEVEFLQSLHGKDGSDVTIDDIYQAYLKENNLTSEQCSLAKFINTYYPDTLLDDETEKSMTEFATQQALRSTVDIAYSCYMETPILSLSAATISGQEVYLIQETTQAAISISAGSGVIYKVTENVAYIITNYHVLYVSNYSNDNSYRTYYHQDTGAYVTASYDESKIKTHTQTSFWGSTTKYNYILKSDFETAPIETHFVDNYDVYLYGYQTADYALSASFVGGSAENDIAVLKIEKGNTENNARIFGEDYKAAAIGDSSSLNVGENVIAVGNPLLANTSNVDTSQITTIEEYVAKYKQSYVDALCLTATDGVVSNTSEYQEFQSLLDSTKAVNMRLIRVSSAINAGNSGGGLYDIEGNLIGIVNGKIASSDYDNVGYVIPVNIATRLADQIIDTCGGIEGETRIKVVTDKVLGIDLDVSKAGTKAPYYDETKLEWVNVNSVVVASVEGAKKAGVAGIKVGDIIDSVIVDGKIYALDHDYDFNDILLKLKCPKTGSISIKINILRKVENQYTLISPIEITFSASDFIVLN